MNILVAEDEAALRHTITAALTLSGYRVMGAETGCEALVRCQETRPDLVLLDLQMPEMNGWEFLRHFRARPDWRHIPVVVMSAAYRAGVDNLDIQAFFEKPFDLDLLLDTIDGLLTEHQVPVGAGDGA
jgi:chemosensory pili system protein ChpA (sensor histidine kinase/response regulator)